MESHALKRTVLGPLVRYKVVVTAFLQEMCFRPLLCGCCDSTPVSGRFAVVIVAPVLAPHSGDSCEICDRCRRRLGSDDAVLPALRTKFSDVRRMQPLFGRVPEPGSAVVLNGE